MGSVANCDSAYASAMALDNQTINTSGVYSEREFEYSPETAEETPQSFNANFIQSLVERVSVGSDLIDFAVPEKPAPYIPFPGKRNIRAKWAKSTNASNLQEQEDLAKSAACLADYGRSARLPYAPTLVSKAQSVPELPTTMMNSCELGHGKTMANVSTGSAVNCDSAYVSTTDVDLKDANSLSSSNGSSETDSTSSSSTEEQECEEGTEEKRPTFVAKYKKNSLSSTAPLVPPDTSTKTAKKSKKQIGDFYQQLVTVLTVIGNITNDMGYLGENMIRLQLNNIEEFGPRFSPGTKIKSVYKAIKHVVERTGIKRADITAECIKIRDALNPNDSDTERVTGIQKDMLLWFLDKMKTYKHTCTAVLEDHLKQYPWLDADGRVSLQNVRRCIKLVHKDLRSTLAFLAQTIDWNDIKSFGSAKPKENKKGRACGHGWYFLIHYSLASYCKAINASNAEQEKLMPFPPSGELELDSRGTIQIGTQAITIEIGEIKASTKGVEKGYIQLKRSLLVSASLCQFVYEDASVPFVLKGYIFVASKQKQKHHRIFPQEKVYTPAGTLHCQVIHPFKYKSAHSTEP
ncbi:uncharacterized protein LOC130697910 isoform X2 [Daphnia carinata]|uniref:uncharacterized protein LOC130697910 isoform X2 n=1 Tax=Daphnia carinata TaxID=120202 RepID=UPI00257C9C92|nr:uncharacterized protein LOC130697910 isoform X2 [Daphnia carinata]